MYDVSELGRSKDWPLILKVGGLLGRAESPYLVGGWLRDRLLGRGSKDIDFAVAGDGIEIAARVARVVGGACVPLDPERRIGRVVLGGGPLGGDRTLDFAACRGSIQEDLSRRDFTIDAIAVDLLEAGSGGSIRLIDPFGGLNDLESRVIRAVTGSVFSDDPARLLRAVRLVAHLGFTVEPQTEAMMRENALLVSRVAGERLREELVSFLSLAGSGHFLSYMDGLGLLAALIPELETARGVTQPREHHWDVLTHSLKTVEAFDYLLGQAAWPYVALSLADLRSSQVNDYFEEQVGFGSNRAALFRLASLLHDVSKPDTKTVEPTGRIRFLGHGDVGAGVADEVLSRLRFSNREMKLIGTAVKYHLRPTQMGWPEMPSRRAIYRYYRDTAEAAVGILYLSLADHMAARGPQLDPDEWRIHSGISKYILSQQTEQPARVLPLIDGYDIMKNLGLSPGRRVGELLESVREAQTAGDISSKEEALALARSLLDAPVSREQNSTGKQSG